MDQVATETTILKKTGSKPFLLIPWKNAHVTAPTCENLDHHGPLLLNDVPVG